MTALVLWTIGAVDRAVSALRGRARVIASGGSRTLEMPSGVSLLLAFRINTGLVGSGLWPVGLLPERKPVQPATPLDPIRLDIGKIPGISCSVGARSDHSG